MDLQPTRTPAHLWGWHARRTTSERYKRERRADTSDSIRTGETEMDGGAASPRSRPPWVTNPGWPRRPCAARRRRLGRGEGRGGRPRARHARALLAGDAGGAGRASTGAERERERDGLGNLDGRVDVKETQGERALGKNASWSINTPFVPKYNNFLAHKICPKI